jgi:hypothetical protein
MIWRAATRAKSLFTDPFKNNAAAIWIIKTAVTVLEVATACATISSS